MDEREEIRARLPIEEVVGRRVELKRSGSTFKGLCPFHQEKTPSFHVSPSRGTFHCFGCGKHGDIFTFVMEAEKVTFPEALKELGDRAGVRLPEKGARKASLRGKLYEANEAAAAFYHAALNEGGGERGRRYLHERSFDREASDLFELGYAPETRDVLGQHLREKGFDDALLLAAGLVMQEEIGGKTRDRFRGRLMFPIRDMAGHVSGFGARALGDAEPKYLNSPQTEIFDKSAVLYGIHRAGEAIRKDGRVILVEGYLDALRAHREGKSNVVASLGTAVTVAQLTALSRLTENVVVALDPDPAGQSAAARAALSALAEITRSRGHAPGSAGTVDLRIARLPAEQGDPDELIRDHPEIWESSLDSAVPAFDFYFQQTLDSLDRSKDAWRQQAIDVLLPVIQQFSTSVGWQAMWIQRLAQETGLDPRTLERALGSAQPRSRPMAREPNGKLTEVVRETTGRGLTSDPLIGIERGLLALLLAVVVVPAEAAEKVQHIELEARDHRILLEALISWRATENYAYDAFRETLPEELREYADDLHERGIPLTEDGAISAAVAFHVARHSRFRLQGRLERSRQLLEEMSPEDREAFQNDLTRLMEDRRQIDQELEFMSLLAAKAGTGSRRA